MSFFDTSQDTRREALRFLDQALGGFNPTALLGEASQLQGFFEGIQRFADVQQRLAGTIGAQASQAAVRRALGPGSAVGGSAGVGFQLGSNFGANLTLRQVAAQDALRAAMGLAQARSQVAALQAQTVLQTQKKSSFDVLKSGLGFVAPRVSAIGEGIFEAGGGQSGGQSGGGQNQDPLGMMDFVGPFGGLFS